MPSSGHLLKLIRFPLLVRNTTGRNLNFTWTFSFQTLPAREWCTEGEGTGASIAVGHRAGASWALSEGLWAVREQPEEAGEQWSIQDRYVSSWREKPVISKEKETEQCAVLFIRMKGGNTVSFAKNALSEKNHECYPSSAMQVVCFWKRSRLFSLIIFYKRVNIIVKWILKSNDLHINQFRKQKRKSGSMS